MNSAMAGLSSAITDSFNEIDNGLDAENSAVAATDSAGSPDTGATSGDTSYAGMDIETAESLVSVAMIETDNLDISAGGLDSSGNASLFSSGMAGVPAEAGGGVDASAGISEAAMGDAAPGAAVSLSTLATYLTNGYWTDTARTSRWYNVTSSGTGANSGTLFYNISGYSGDADGLSAARQTMAREAFKIYGQILGINFVETTADNTNVDFFFKDNGAGAGNVTTVYSGTGGAIDYSVINVAASWNGGTSAIGDYTFQTFLHEIGHALGLGHQGNYNGSGGYATDAIYGNDSWALSMMSYFDQVENTSSTTSNYDFARLISPMSVDWIALNALYAGQGFGVNNAFTGNTVWGFNTNITAGQSAAYNAIASLASTSAFTIIDGGGTDTVDFSGFAADQTINLQLADASSTTGTVSNVGGLIGNMTIAVGTVIENAVGGSGNDTIYGNEYNNTLTGNAGNDTIKGLGGSDTLYGGAGIDNLYGGDGSDTISDGNNNSVYGGAGNDYIIDTFVLGGTWDGGADVDTIDLSGDNFAANIDLSAASFTAFGATFTGFENAVGTLGNDTITGSGVDNVLKGMGGNDTIIGGAGIDTLVGGDGNDTITDSGNNSVTGDAGDDYITNTFVSGGTWDGGAGNDTIDLSSDNFTATIDLSAASFTAFGATFSNFENAVGTQGNDTITGTSGDNTLSGSGGNDTIYGGGGTDTVYGGTGNDTLEGGFVTDNLYGGDGDDLLRVLNGEFYDNSYGGLGTDTLDHSLSSYGGSTFDFEAGTITGAGINGASAVLEGIEVYYDGSGANTIISSGTNGSYYGGGGDDVMIAEIGGEFMYGGAGTDLIDLTRFNGVYIVDMGTGSSNYGGETFQGFENLNSGSGDDTITGNSSFNIVNTGAGNDTIIDNDASDDNLDGGAGVDKLISDLTYVDDVLFNFNTGLATFSGGTFLHFSNIENLTVGGGADVIGDGNANVITITDTGFVHTNVVDGGGGNDTINTGIGDDTLIGGAGADTLNGGAGTDTVDYSIASTVVVVHLDTPTQYGQYGSGGGGAIETDTLIAIENVTTGSGADYVYGSAGDNVINTNAGNDAVYAGNGADTVNTGAGQDYVEGSYGADTIDAGADNDKVYGGADNDIIYGGDGNDSLYGNHGNDQIYGGNGVDVLFIDSTDTTYDGGAGVDYIVWNDAVVAANLDITAHSADYFYGYTGADIVTAIGALAHTELHGGGGGDTLTGSNGVGSHLLGEDGNDRLISGTGTDYMVGGAGADTFVFGPGGGTDYVYDFKTGGADVIDFTALAGLGIHSLANLIINTAYAASGWFGYSYGSGTAWLNTTAVGSTQPVAADFLFA